MRSLIAGFAMLIATPALSADEIKVPSRMTCFVVKKLYVDYEKKGYTREQMKNFLRYHAKIPEAKITSAERCLG